MILAGTWTQIEAAWIPKVRKTMAQNPRRTAQKDKYLVYFLGPTGNIQNSRGWVVERNPELSQEYCPRP